MAQVRFTNNAKTTLNGAINNSVTTIVVTDGSVLPALSGGDWFYLTLEDNVLTREIVKVTARSTHTLTVVRGQDGTAAASWATGVKAENRLTNAAMSEIAAAVSGITPTSAFLALVDDTTNGAMLTTLGISSFAQTLLDDTTAGAFMTTLGINANAQTWLTTPSSANLLATVTDETGTGALVFGTSPSLTTPAIAGATISGAWTGSHSIVGTTTLQQSGGNFQFHIDNGANTKQISSWFSSSDDQWNLQPRSAGSLVSSKAINYNFTSGLWVIPSASLTTPTIAGGALSGTFSGAHTYSGVVTSSGGLVLTLASNEQLKLWRDGAAISWYEATGVTRRGYIQHDGGTTLNIRNEVTNGNVDVVTAGTGLLRLNSDPVMTRGATETVTGTKTFSANITATNGAGVSRLGITGDITGYRTGGTTGYHFFNSASTAYLGFDGTNFTFVTPGGGTLNWNSDPVMTRGATETVTGVKTHAADINFSGYRAIKMPTGNAYGRAQGYYNWTGGAHDHYILSCNWNVPAGTVDNAALGTNYIDLRAVNGSNGQIVFGTGSVNTAPSMRAYIDNTGMTATDFFVSSDEKLKKDFVPFTNALEKVRQLRTGEYTRISTGQREVGFMAQDFERAGEPLFVEKSMDYKTLRYHRTPALLAAAIKELLLRIEALETRLAS